MPLVALKLYYVPVGGVYSSMLIIASSPFVFTWHITTTTIQESYIYIYIVTFIINESLILMLLSVYRGMGATLPAWMTSREGGPASLPEKFPAPRQKNSGRVPTDGLAMSRKYLEMPRVRMS